MKVKNPLKKGLSISAIIVLLLIILIGLLVAIKYTNQVELTQLKNNSQSQMMGYIIKTKNNQVIVIDGGTDADAENLINHINELGGKVNFWFITHPHKDHAGAFIKIVNETQIPIENIYVSLNDMEWYNQYENERANEAQNLIDTLQNNKIKENVHEVSLNEQLNLDGIRCEILGTKNPEITTNAINNSSMVIKMYINSKSILFLGDTGVESGNKLLDTQKEKLKSTIVQVAHHGQNGATEELYKAISPEIALWPTPEWLWNNDNGGGEDSGEWKTKETRSWLEKLGVRQNIIEKDGDITIKVY